MKQMSNYIWYEKHRPSSFGQMTLPKGHRQHFKKFSKDKQIPHLLFVGARGSGKTTSAKIIINKLKAQSLELNASSDDRGIETMKTKVKSFAMSQPISKNALKIILLEEAHGITLPAQESLLNTVEKYSKHTRFIFTTTKPAKVDEALRSRCMEFSFAQISIESAKEILIDILEDEKIEHYKDRDLDRIISLFFPDMRTLINRLQQACMSGSLVLDGIVPDVDFKKISKFLKSGEIGFLRKYLEKIFDYTSIYKFLMSDFIYYDLDNNEARKQIALIVAEYLYRDTSVVDKDINFTACAIEIASVLKRRINFGLENGRFPKEPF